MKLGALIAHVNNRKSAVLPLLNLYIAQDEMAELLRDVEDGLVLVAVDVGSVVRGHVVGVDGNTATAATQTGSTAVTNSTPASALTAGTGAAATLQIRGSFEITAAGTIVPSITMVTAAASVLAVGSYMTFERIGSTSVTSVGQWD